MESLCSPACGWGRRRCPRSLQRKHRPSRASFVCSAVQFARVLVLFRSTSTGTFSVAWSFARGMSFLLLGLAFPSAFLRIRRSSSNIRQNASSDSSLRMYSSIVVGGSVMCSLSIKLEFIYRLMIDCKYRTGFAISIPAFIASRENSRKNSYAVLLLCMSCMSCDLARPSAYR
jgi:hypothetical protein